MAEQRAGTTTLNVADDQRLRASHLFTSESVTEGHPDKIADQISDAILDAAIEQDPKSRVACETLVTTGLVVVAGEITTSTYVDIPTLVRKRVAEIGYTAFASQPKTHQVTARLIVRRVRDQNPDHQVPDA